MAVRSAAKLDDNGLETNDADIAVGNRIRHLRKARGRSLKEVALRAGLSVGFLSQIERGLSSVSIRVLARLADSLDAAIGDIFPGPDIVETAGPPFVARVADRRHMDFPAKGMSKELLTPFELSPRIDIYIMTLAPGGSSGDQPFTHQGEEAGVVLEGGIELVVDGRKAILGKGDSFRFSSTLPHEYRNAGSGEAKAFWINFRD